MNTETKFETYTFSYHNENDIGTNLTFTVPAVGLHISTFHDMCRKFALACGYTEKSVEEYFGEWDDEAYEEFME